MNNDETYFDSLPEELLILMSRQLKPKEIYTIYNTNFNVFKFLNNKQFWINLYKYKNIEMLRDSDDFYGYFEDYLNIKNLSAMIKNWLSKFTKIEGIMYIELDKISNLNLIIKGIPELYFFRDVYFNDKLNMDCIHRICILSLELGDAKKLEFYFHFYADVSGTHEKLINLKIVEDLLLRILFYGGDVKYKDH